MNKAKKFLVALGGVGLASAGFVGYQYSRMLPVPAIPREIVRESVHQEPALLERAMALPSAREFAGGLRFQENGTTCGPASLGNILRVLGEAETNEEAVLASTSRCPLGVCFGGLTLDELAEVARANTDRKVEVLRNLSPEMFREHLRAANEGHARYIVNFLRKPIFGRGGGHHSPIGGYLEAEDLVLVLDVNENYKPWLVEREKLFAAIDTLDGTSKRGLLRIE